MPWKLAQKVVSGCQVCRSIDPAPVRWEEGHLSVPEVWQRLAMDITHVRGVPYLSMIDCGPSRFAIWRQLTRETAAAVIAHVNQVFRERGPPAEVLTDNGPCFRSQEFAQALQGWPTAHFFSCAYRPAGNGIIERHHRTIKRMVARTGRSAEEMAVWYNSSPNDDGDTPLQLIYRYDVRQPCDHPPELDRLSTRQSRFEVGDAVFVKPRNNTCMTQWTRGCVSAILSDVSVEVDGVPRHIADLRVAERLLGADFRAQQVTEDDDSGPCRLFDLELSDGEDDLLDISHEQEDELSNQEEAPARSDELRRSDRIRAPPDRYGLAYAH